MASYNQILARVESIRGADGSGSPGGGNNGGSSKGTLADERSKKKVEEYRAKAAAAGGQGAMYWLQQARDEELRHQDTTWENLNDKIHLYMGDYSNAAQGYQKSWDRYMTQDEASDYASATKQTAKDSQTMGYDILGFLNRNKDNFVKYNGQDTFDQLWNGIVGTIEGSGAMLQGSKDLGSYYGQFKDADDFASFKAKTAAPYSTDNGRGNNSYARQELGKAAENASAWKAGADDRWFEQRYGQGDDDTSIYTRMDGAVKDLEEQRRQLLQQRKELWGGKGSNMQYFGQGPSYDETDQEAASREIDYQIRLIDQQIANATRRRDMALDNMSHGQNAAELIGKGYGIVQASDEQFAQGFAAPTKEEGFDYEAWALNNPEWQQWQAEHPGGTMEEFAKTFRADRRVGEGWTDQQRNQFYILQATVGQEAADRFALDINTRLRKQKREDDVAATAEFFRGDDMSKEARAQRSGIDNFDAILRNVGTGALGIAGSVATAPEHLLNWVEDVTRAADSRREGYYAGSTRTRLTDYTDAAVSSRAQALNEDYGTLSDKWGGVLGGKGLGDIYQLAQSMAQSVTYGNVAGEAATLLMFFGQAADQSYQEAIDRGGSTEYATVVSLLSGLAEVAGEKIGLDHLLNPEKALAKSTLRYLLEQGGIEGAEEGVTDLMNIFGDALASRMTGNESEMQQKIRGLMESGMNYDDAVRQVWKDQAKETAWSVAGGFLSGFGSGVSQHVVSGGIARDVARKKIAKQSAAKIAEDIKANNPDLADADALGQAIYREAHGLDLSKKQQDAIDSHRDVADPYLKDIQVELRRQAERNIDYKERQERAQKVNPTERVTINGKTGNINGLRFDKDSGTVSVELKLMDGSTETVSVDDAINASSNETGELLYRLAGMGQDAVAAYKLYEKGQAVEDFVIGMDMAINKLAAQGATRRALDMTMLTRDLTKAQKDFAYEIGHQRYEKLPAHQKVAFKENASVSMSGNMEGNTPPGVTGLREQSTYETKREAKQAWAKDYDKNMAVLTAVSKATGLDVVVFSSKKADGSLSGVRGAFVESGTIYVDIYAGYNHDVADTIIARTLSHELTHYLEKNAPEQYKALQEFVVNNLAEMGKGRYEAAIYAKLNNRSSVTNETEAIHEVVADACEMMLTNSEMIQKLAAENLTLAEKFWNYIKSVFAKLKAELKPDSREAQWLQGKYDEMSKLWDAALESAVKSAKDLSESSHDAMVDQRVADGKAITPQDEVDYSLRENERLMDAAIAMNNKTHAVSDKVMDRAMMARGLIAREFRYRAKGLNLPEDVMGNTFLPDASYGGTMENTTVCIRSLAAQALMDQISKKLGRPLTVDETLMLSQEIANWTDKPECFYCYVATDRRAYREYLGNYDKQRQEVLGKAAKLTDEERQAILDMGKAPKKANRKNAANNLPPLYKEFLNGRADTDNMRNRIKLWVGTSQADLISSSDLASLDELAKELSELDKIQDKTPAQASRYAQLKDAADYAQKASWAKKNMGYTAYDGKILSFSDEKVKSFNDHYGLRMYSFSDFSAAFILENMQMITDAAARGLKMLAYTKEMAFAEIFAATGININISVYASMVNGQIIRDEMMGANWEKAIALREKYPNVGLTLVATNDEIVKWGMDLPYVDVIIPYHLVRTGKAVADHFGFTNYTSESADGKILKARAYKGKVTSISPTMHNNDVVQYARALHEHKLTPRFARWLVGYEDFIAGKMSEAEFRAANPNYMKLVNETRQTAAQTKPVQPIFDVDAAMAAIKEMRARGGYGIAEILGPSYEHTMQEISDKVAGQIKGSQLSEREYDNAVRSGDMDRAAVLVNQAAKNAGAITTKTGRSALHLYHGTPSFGFTEFRPGVIFLTDNPSIAAGYTQNKGYGRKRQISEKYIQDDGTTETLLKNIRNVLGRNYREATASDAEEIHESMRKETAKIVDRVNDAWTSEAMDSLREILGEEYTDEFENKLYTILALPQSIDENLDDIFERPDTPWANDIRNDLERWDGYRNDIRQAFVDHYKELKNSAANDLRDLIIGFDLSDYLIDAQYSMLKALEISDMLVAETGSLVSKDIMRQGVERAKDVGAYDLYAFAGDNPLVIDGKGAFWTNIEVPELGGVFMTDEIAKLARARGYTSVTIRNIMDSSMNNYASNVNSDIYIMFDQNQVKSADPVTYDDDGNVIPLSQRFNSAKGDIRYSEREDVSWWDDAKVESVKDGLNFRDPSGQLLDRVFSRSKVYETRSYTVSSTHGELPKSLLNRPIGIVQTGAGKAKLVGFWELGDGVLRDSSWLAEHRAELGNDGTEFEAVDGDQKWVYPIKWVIKTNAIEVTQNGIRSRGIEDITKRGMKVFPDNPDAKKVQMSERDMQDLDDDVIRDFMTRRADFNQMTYFPIRKDTPQKVIDVVREKTGIELPNLPILLQFGKLTDAIDVHGIEDEQLIQMFHDMDRPRNIVYQTKNQRIVVVCKIPGTSTFAIMPFDFNDNKNQDVLNGYPGGVYNVDVTFYHPQNQQNPDRESLQHYLEEDENIILYPDSAIDAKRAKKLRDISRRGLGSFVPALSNDISLVNSIAKDLTKSNTKSSLSERDFVDTDTPAFRKWFGDSKVVNRDGSPKIVYHQTGGDFTVFNTDNPVAGANDSETPNGIFFKENDHDIGLGGKKQMAVYLSIQNPLRFADRKQANAWYQKNIPGYKALQDEMDSKIKPLDAKMDQVENAMFMDGVSDDQYNALDKQWNEMLEEMHSIENDYRGRLREILDEYFLRNDSGYDGIELEYDGHRYIDGKRENVHTWIIFDNTQVKSATDNVGTFDRGNPDIRYSERDNTVGDLKEETAERVRSYNQLKADNAALQRQIQRLKRELKPTKENTVRAADARKLAKELLSTIKSDVDVNELAGVIERIGNYLVQTETDELDYDVIRGWAAEAARDIVETAEEPVETGMEDVNKTLKQYLNGKRLKISKNDIADLGQESLTAWKKANPGIRVGTQDGLAVDVAYQELQDMLGEGLLPSDVTHPADQLNRISELLQDSSREETRNPFKGYEGEVIETLTEDIINAALGEQLRQTAPTFADKKAAQISSERAKGKQKLEEQKAKDREKLAEMRSRNKDRLSDIRKNTQARIDEVRAKERAEKWKKVESLRKFYQEKERAAAAKRRETKKSTELRHKIRKLHTDLTRRLTKPVEGKYVPEPLIKSVAEVLDSFNLDSGKSERLTKAYDKLHAQYRQLKNAEGRFAYAFNPAVAEMLENTKDILTLNEGKSIYEMDSNDLLTLYRTLQAVDYTVRHAVKAINYETNKNLYEIGAGMAGETKAAKPIPGKVFNSWLNSSMSPTVFFKRLGGWAKNSNWSLMADMLDKAQLKQTQIQMESAQFFGDLIKDTKNYDKFTSHKDLIDIGLKDLDGNTVKVPRDFAAKIYLDTFDVDAARHLMYGAYSMPDFKEYYKSRTGDAYNNGTRIQGYGGQMAVLYEELIAAETKEEEQAVREKMKALEEEAQSWMQSIRDAISDNLGDYGMKWVKAWRDYTEYSQKVLNETTKAMYGFEKATIENYVPIHVDPNFRAAQFDSITNDISLENAGFMKDRVVSKKPMLGEGIVDVANMQIDKVAKYSAMMPAIQNFTKAYSMVRRGGSESVQSVVGAKFKQSGTDYIEHILRDLTSPRQGEGGILNDFMNAVRGNVALASLTLNPRVALGQTASYPTAAAVVGWKALAKAAADVGNNPIYNEKARAEVAKWSPLLWYRMQGFFNSEMGDLRNDKTYAAKINNRLKFLTGWINAMDGLTVGKLWVAAEYYVKDNYKGLPGDEFKKKQAEVFNQIIEKTQPNYSTFQRPDILRNPNAIYRQMTMFMTQRLQNVNILYDAVGTYNRYAQDLKAGKITEQDMQEARTGLLRAVSSQVAAAATIVVFKALADALLYSMKRYRDDDDELTGASVLNRLINDFAESLISNFLWGSEFYSILDSVINKKTYYGISMGGIDTFKETIEQIVNTAKDPSRESALKLAKAAAQFLGIPANNVAKFYNAVANRVKDAQEGNGFWEYASEIKKTNFTQARELFKAMQAGDQEKIDELEEYFGSKSQAQDALAAYIKKQFKAGRMTEDEAFKALRENAGYTEDDAFWAIQTINGGEKYNCWSDLEAAAQAGDQEAYGEAADFLGDHGYEGTEIRNHMKSAAHKWYTTGEEGRPRINKEAAIKYLTEYAGMSEWEAKDQVREWTIEVTNGFSYSEIQDRFLDGDLEYSRAIDLLLQYGPDGETTGEVKALARRQAAEKVDEWRCEKETGIRYGNIQDAFIHGDITGQQAIDWQVKYGHKDRETAQQRVQEWNAAKDYGVKYGSSDYGIKDAYLHDEISAETAKAIMITYGGKTEEEAEAYTAQYEFTKETGYEWRGGDGIQDAILSGKYSDDVLAQWEARANTSAHGSVQAGMEYVQVAHWLAEVPGCDSFNRTNLEKWEKYGSKIIAAGMGQKEFAAASEIYNKTHSDYDSETGESIANSKCRKVLEQINEMNLTRAQKETLARSLYSQKSIRKAGRPW